MNIVETQAIAAGLPLPKVGLIDTPALNAFACGISRASAVVVLTRGLVEALDDDELAAVVAHEIAHIRNGDIRLIAAANVMLGNLLLLQTQNPLRIVNWRQILLIVLLPPFLVLFLGAGLLSKLAFVLARVSRLVISSSREFVADAEAVRMTHNPHALITALLLIEGQSAIPGLNPEADAMMIDGPARGAFATHPTIAERVAVLTRLSGEALLAPAPRKDTRTFAHQSTGQDSFGRRNARPAEAVGAPGLRLAARVSEGAETNLFGLTPAMSKMVFGGVAVVLMVAYGGVDGLKGLASLYNPATLKEIFAAPLSGGSFIGAVDGQAIAAADPEAARCFATDRYSVGDRGLYALDGSPIANGAHAPSEISMDRYLGYKRDAVARVAAAQGDALGPALRAYVETRELMLTVTHRFFGEPGLRALQESYASPGDVAVLELLAARFDAGDPALRAEPATAAKIRFLVSSPADFVPCQARQQVG
ncbi:MAG: M48 family metalloprotease [Pseudomonadota bacterium]|nr:M48 family metalloprotease [Pseudomonadota bacterium]